MGDGLTPSLTVLLTCDNGTVLRRRNGNGGSTVDWRLVFEGNLNHFAMFVFREVTIKDTVRQKI